MSTFASAPALASVTPLDPSKHVRFTQGMVLGVADFTQEFAYLSGADRRIVRDLVGYGVVTGLRLSVDPPPAGSEDQGPRVGVSPGEAVLPSGRLVCVTPAQCAFLGEWVAAHSDGLDALSPPEEVSAFVVLRYAECETDNVPIPGEPCRDEANLMAPSRVKDHFALELRAEPPDQHEEDEVRWLAGWLAAVPVGDPGSELEEFLDALRVAALAEGGSPPVDSVPEEPDPLPPPGLAIPAGRESEYLQAAFALWTRELRGRWQTRVPGCECAPGPSCSPSDDALLLGELRIPVTWDAISAGWVIGAADTVAIDLSRRATLVHLRLLQEWLLSSRASGRATAARAVVRTDVSPPEVLAVGVDVFAVDDRVFHLVPDAFDPTAGYAVTGSAVGAVTAGPSAVLDVLDPSDPALGGLVGALPAGITVRAQTADGSAAARGFSVVVEKLGGVG